MLIEVEFPMVLDNEQQLKTIAVTVVSHKNGIMIYSVSFKIIDWDVDYHV